MKLVQLFENAITDTHEFKQWFGNSKIVDGSGNPLLVYHGTNADFDKFDYRLAGMGNDTGMRGRGLYFSPHKQTSQSYGKNLLEVYLSVKNPLIPTDYKTVDAFIDALGLTSEVNSWGLDSYIPGIFKFEPDTGRLTVMSRFAGRFTEIVKDAGFDGIIYTPGNEIIVYSDDQVKIVSKT